MPSLKPWNNYVMVCNTCYERWEGNWGNESLQTARRQCSNCLRDLMEGVKIIPKEKYDAII